MAFCKRRLFFAIPRMSGRKPDLRRSHNPDLLRSHFGLIMPNKQVWIPTPTLIAPGAGYGNPTYERAATRTC